MIDLHTHLHPPRLFAAIRRWFAEHTEWDLSARPSRPREIAEELLANGVERFVFFSYAHKPGIARDLNAWLCETARALSGAGIPLGTIHLDDRAYLDDLDAALEGGCAGIKIHEDVQRLAVDDPRFASAYERIVARDGVVLAHVGPIPWTYRPLEGVQRVRRVLERHPRLRFVVAHMGVPDTAAYCALADEHPNLHLDTTMVFAHGSPMEHGIDRALVERYAERILYGTDFPNTPYPYGAERRGLEALRLSAPALEAILSGNARRLLRPFL